MARQIPPFLPFLKGGYKDIPIFEGILPTHFHDEPKLFSVKIKKIN